MSVHSEPQRFKIFADGNADIRRIESLVSSSSEMILRAGLRQRADVNNLMEDPEVALLIAVSLQDVFQQLQRQT